MSVPTLMYYIFIRVIIVTMRGGGASFGCKVKKGCKVVSKDINRTSTKPTILRD